MSLASSSELITVTKLQILLPTPAHRCANIPLDHFKFETNKL